MVALLLSHRNYIILRKYKHKIKEILEMKVIFKRLFWIAIGQFISAFAVSQVLAANNLVSTGFGGVAIIFNQLFGLNMQLMLVCMAVPVFIWAFFFYDKKQIFYAAFSYFMFTFYLGIVKALPEFKSDMIVVVVFGGILTGIASGIVMKQNVANGPEAIIALYLKEKKGISVGTFFLMINTAVICAAILYGDLTIIIYSFMTSYIQSVVTDYIIIGTKKLYNVNVQSSSFLTIASYIQSDMKRDVTLVRNVDGSNVKRGILVQTILTKNELINLKEYIKTLNDDTVLYANQTSTVIGRGFNLE